MARIDRDLHLVVGGKIRDCQRDPDNYNCGTACAACCDMGNGVVRLGCCGMEWAEVDGRDVLRPIADDGLANVIAMASEVHDKASANMDKQAALIARSAGSADPSEGGYRPDDDLSAALGMDPHEYSIEEVCDEAAEQLNRLRLRSEAAEHDLVCERERADEAEENLAACDEPIHGASAACEKIEALQAQLADQAAAHAKAVDFLSAKLTAAGAALAGDDDKPTVEEWNAGL